MATSSQSKRLVSVSNGIEFLLIPRDELPDAEASGYYRPESRGLTIIEKEGRLYEVALDESRAAEHSGYRDLLSRERRRPQQVDSVPNAVPTCEAAETKLEANSLIGGTRVTANADEPLAATPAVSMIPLSLIEAVTQSDREAEEQRIEQERQINEATGWRKQMLRFQFWFAAHQEGLLRQLGTNGLSIALHVVILLLLASFFLVSPERKEIVIMASPSTSDDIVEEFTMQPEVVEITEPTQAEDADASPIEEVIPEISEAAETPDFLAAVSSMPATPPKTPSKPAPIPGEGMESAKGKPTFFGSKFAAINYVFVIDNSNSMTKGRFETALIQLMLTVNQLTPKQRFYVIFYSDTAYGMMHPNRVANLVVATPKNKLLLGNWLNTVPLCLKTNGKEAIQAALDLDPDVIYVLGDGAFTDGAAKQFAAKPHPRIIIHTRGMEVDEKNAREFKLLATSHKGTYRDVGVMPEGATLAKQYPRPRNNKRGPVWGITLPLP